MSVCNNHALRKLPNVFIEAAEFFLYFKECIRIRDSGVHFQFIADNRGVLQKFFDALLGKSHNLFGVEVGKCFSISFSLTENSQP